MGGRQVIPAHAGVGRVARSLTLRRCCDPRARGGRLGFDAEFGVLSE